jgi:hypothetical protein
MVHVKGFHVDGRNLWSCSLDPDFAKAACAERCLSLYTSMIMISQRFTIEISFDNTCTSRT